MFRSTAVVVLLALTSAAAAQAQSRIGLELRGGAAFPTQDFADGTLKTGAGFGATASFRVLPHLHVYGGWDWYSFVPDEAFLGGDYDVEQTGYAFGMQFGHPLFNSVGGWLRAGGIYSHLELENDAGDIVEDSGHDLGWEVGGGLTIPVTGSISLTPGVRYRSLSTELTMGQTTTPVDLRSVNAELGVRFTFGGSREVATARAR